MLRGLGTLLQRNSVPVGERADLPVLGPADPRALLDLWHQLRETQLLQVGLHDHRGYSNVLTGLGLLCRFSTSEQILKTQNCRSTDFLIRIKQKSKLEFCFHLNLFSFGFGLILFHQLTDHFCCGCSATSSMFSVELTQTEYLTRSYFMWNVAPSVQINNYSASSITVCLHLDSF